MQKCLPVLQRLDILYQPGAGGHLVNAVNDGAHVLDDGLEFLEVDIVAFDGDLDRLCLCIYFLDAQVDARYVGQLGN